MSKEKPLYGVVRDPSTSAEVKVRESTLKTLNDYAEFLKENTDTEVEIGEILDEVVPQAFRKDKAFQNFLTNAES